jgi:PAS domain S-box-containing protein
LFAVIVLLAALAVAELVALTSANAPQLHFIVIAGIVVALLGTFAALVGLHAVARELLEHRRIEAELRASEAKFAGILAIAADAIITIDENQRILHYNIGAERIFGWSAAEMIGESLTRLLPDRFRSHHEDHITDFAKSGDVARRMGSRRAISGLRKDGVEFPAEASISSLSIGDGRIFTVVLRDITERKREEENERFLARAAATLGTSLDYASTLRSVVHLPIPFLADCCVIDIAVEGSQLRRLVSVHEDPDITKRLRMLEESATVPDWPFPVTEVMASGRSVLRRELQPGWEVAGSPGGDGAALVGSLGIQAFLSVPLIARERAIGALTLISTDRRRVIGEAETAIAESLARQAAFAIDTAWLYQAAQRATAARDEVLSVVSHDLRNPLSAISMCARVLMDAPPADLESRREMVGAILESTTIMNHLIQDLLDVSAIESGHLRLTRRSEALQPLLHQVQEMHRQAARDRGVAVEAVISPDMPPVHADAMRLVQVLTNLVGNAVKFTESGGHVTIRAAVDGNAARLSVADTGIGIPPEHLSQIFDRWWHAKRSSRTAGTGLGLAIARGIILAHGGRIWVESTLGSGSIFFFTLPLAADRASDAEERPATSHASVL